MRTGGEHCRDGLVDDGDSRVDLAFGNGEGQGHAKTVEHAAGGAHDIHGEAPSQAFIPHSDAQRIGWLFGLSLFDQLDDDEQSFAAHIPDLLMTFLQVPQPREQWNMTREAWQDVVARLDDEDALMCWATALLLRKGRDIPPEEREQAIKRLQAILNDEMRSRRPLDPPGADWLRLDDVLFDTLRALAECG
jgi:hypothetical protein